MASNAFAGSMWRSEPMTYVRITMPREAARIATEKLGDIGKMEFVDVCLKNQIATISLL